MIKDTNEKRGRFYMIIGCVQDLQVTPVLFDYEEKRGSEEMTTEITPGKA